MSQNVYITNASLNIIFKSLRNKKSHLSREELLSYFSSDFENEFEGTRFYENMHICFNNMELKEIYFESMVLKDFKKILDDIDGNKNIIAQYISNSNKTYALKVKEPAYHSFMDCQFLKSSFRNIIIPEDCRIDSESREKIEEWIKNNEHLEFTNLNAKFKIEFQCDCDLIEINRPNSGNMEFENYEVKLNRIVEIKNKFKQLRFFFDSEFANKINNLKYASTFKLKSILKNDSDTLSHETVIEFHAVKDSLRQMIKNYYKEKYNDSLSFDKNLLDAIGFRICNGCNK